MEFPTSGPLCSLPTAALAATPGLLHLVVNVESDMYVSTFSVYITASTYPTPGYFLPRSGALRCVPSRHDPPHYKFLVR